MAKVPSGDSRASEAGKVLDDQARYRSSTATGGVLPRNWDVSLG